jgi:hypothetical protein
MIPPAKKIPEVAQPPLVFHFTEKSIEADSIDFFIPITCVCGRNLLALHLGGSASLDQWHENILLPHAKGEW